MPDKPKTLLKEAGIAIRPGAVLREAEGGGQIREVVIISEGWGSSGYYSADVLKRDIPRIYPVGTHMYLNHPTEREDIERPERSVSDLVGKLVKTPRLAGIDMVAEALIYPHWEEVIEAMKDDIGLSIVAYGIAEEGDAGGKRGPIIKALTEGQSVDYVTHAGAGGKIGKLIESAREAQPLEEKRNTLNWLESKIHRDFTYYADNLFGDGYITREERKALSSGIGSALDSFATAVTASAPQLLNRDPYADPEGEEVDVEEGKRGRAANRTTKETQMEVDDREFAALKESVKTLNEAQKETDKKVSEAVEREKEATERAERAEEALVTREGRAVAEKAVAAKYPGLSDKAQARAVEASLADVPTKEVNGKTVLDESALKESAEAKATKEAEYLAEAGAGTVEGFGKAADATSTTVTESGGSDSEADKAAKKALQESFESRGMSKEAAEAAVEGR